ncbi:MAG: sensor histidine kinase [Beduini sp.]|uniref:sensor histidine kinase n=1 Tax=Beduini sp. TaxID=1922300 RepID=UPI003990B0F2
MTKIMDKCIFYILGWILLFLYGLDFYSIVVLLGALIFSSLYYLWEDKAYSWILPLLIGICCFFNQSFLAFLPLAIYDLFGKESHGLIALFALPFIWNIFLCDGLFLFAVVIGAMMAVILKKRYEDHQKIDALYRLQRDQSQEISMLLTKQNRDLIVQKDYEVQLAILSERNRIAREIHDHAGHGLSSSLLQVGALIAINQQENIKEPLLNLKKTLTESLDAIRSNVHDMKDYALDLEVAINKIIKAYPQYSIHFAYDIIHLDNIQLKYTIIAIVKEAIHNTYKHSDATKMDILLREQPVFYQLIIKDNGTPSTIQGNGMGLKNMRDRVEQYKGYINFKTEAGFEIFITIPKEEK